MGKRNSFNSGGTLVDKFIGTSYDVVKTVYDNLAAIITVSEIEDIGAIGENSANVSIVADISGDVTTVADDIIAVQNASANALTATTKAAEAVVSAAEADTSASAASASETAAETSANNAAISESDCSTPTACQRGELLVA